MFKLRWYASIGILTYLIFFTANIPASFVVKQLKGPLGRVGVNLQSVTGTIWNGAASVTVKRDQIKVPMIALNWEVHGWKLLIAQLALDYQLRGQGISVVGELDISPHSVSVIDASARLAASLVNVLIEDQGAEISGDIELQSLNVHLTNKRVASASGRLNWGGGQVAYKQGGRTQSVDFPAIVGEFSEKAGGLGLLLSDAVQDRRVVEAEIMPTGWAKVAIMKRILEMLGQMKVGKGGDKPIFEVQQKLF
jgi:general secretion pathway protein N